MESGQAALHRTDSQVRADIDRAIEYLTSHQDYLLAQPVSVFPLSPTITVNVQDYETQDFDNLSFETHHGHIDIHCVLSGQEWFRFADKGLVAPNTEYDADNDIIFYPHPEYCNQVLLRSGSYALVYPEDMHCAHGCVDRDCSSVRKIVIKIECPPESAIAER